jgi:hypothetical protein
MTHPGWSEKCVLKKTGDGYTAWFSPTQSFVFLKGPAYDVFQLMEQGEENEAIIKILKQRPESSEDEIYQFVTELRSDFEQLMNPANIQYKCPSDPGNLQTYIFEHFTEKFYLIKGISFHFVYGNREIFQQFDPALSHLSMDNKEKTDFIIEIFSSGNLLVFRLNGRLIEHFDSNHIHFLQGAVLKKLAGLLYNIPDDDWMASLHASAISNGKSAILFSAKPGNGKSTVAALLQARGYLLLSDDFITLDNRKEHVWQMPLAISVKEGSLKLLSNEYPRLKESSTQSTPAGKHVNYLSPKTNSAIKASSFPVKYIIFIKYSPEITFLCEKIKKEEAIMNLLAETWVNPNRKNVQQFLNWFEAIDCFRLTYSDQEKLFEEIKKRFQT